MKRSKTIQIFLKDSDPNGIKIAELSVSTAKVYVIPRKDIDFANTRKDLSTPALYMLFDDERTSVYIGECENFIDRIKDHVVNKAFWKWAVVVVSSNEALDKADVKFLESHAITKAVEIGRFEVQNRASPSENKLHEFKRETVLDFFNDVVLLLSTLGFNLFEPLKEEIELEKVDKTSKKEVVTNVRDYDTIVCPSTGQGLENPFRKKSAWGPVKIGQPSIGKLKYVALYEGFPVSAIRYFAKIVRIEPVNDKPGKYMIYHDGNIIELEKPVILGKTPQLALRSPRYYKLEDIKSSENMAELTNKTYGSNY